MVVMRNTGYCRLSTRSGCAQMILSIIDIVIIISYMLTYMVGEPIWGKIH